MDNIYIKLSFNRLVFIFVGEKVADVPCESPTFSVAWHPKKQLLAYACDDKDKYERDRDAGTIKLFGIPSDNN